MMANPIPDPSNQGTKQQRRRKDVPPRINFNDESDVMNYTDSLKFRNGAPPMEGYLAQGERETNQMLGQYGGSY